MTVASRLLVAEALERVLLGAAVLGTEQVPLAQALGRTLAAPIVALHTQPPFRSSAMDGYAVRASEASEGAQLTIGGESAAGHVFSGSLPPGGCIRIFTGGAVPDDADAVLIQENTERTGDIIRVLEGVETGQFVRPAGLDFNAGETLLSAGSHLTPRRLALAAATGNADIDVARRPRVAVLATGDELVLPGDTLRNGQIFLSNSVALCGLITAAGGEAMDLGIARDDTDVIREAVRRAFDGGADLLVTTGGASVGEHDLVRGSLEAEGLALAFWRIAMRPGRPMMFGRLGQGRFLGLPGNPVSAHVCAVLFLVPLIRALQGRSDVGHRFECAELGRDLPPNEWREDYVRARTEPGTGVLPVAVPFARQDSSMLRLLSEADCLLVRPAHDPARRAGETCRIIRLDHSL